MTKVVNGTTLQIEMDGRAYMINTLYYEDGRVIENCGNGDWVQIKDPDIFVQAVGKCKDCGQIIYEDEDWDFKDDGKGGTAWVRHQTEEDCKK